MAVASRAFYKMSGSGNDFVFFDARDDPMAEWSTPVVIGKLCERGTGIGADGVVFLEHSTRADLAIRYYNRDGSLASLCGNASLCATSLAIELGAAKPEGFRLETGSGVLAARIRGGLPEIQLSDVVGVQPEVPGIVRQDSEQFLGFALAGVPHVVIPVEDLGAADVTGRGRALRMDSAFSEGANINFLAPAPDGRGWQIRTYERGVEEETLACGTGAVASAILLNIWGLAGPEVELRPRSGSTLKVTLNRRGDAWEPWLQGPGQVVFEGLVRGIA